MYRKLCFAFLCIGLTFPSVSAHNAVKVTSPSNQETVYMLENHPKVGMDKDVVTIATDKEEMSIENAYGMKFEFIDFEPLSVDRIAWDAPAFKIGTDKIEGYNLPALVLVEVADLTGRIMSLHKTDENGNVIVDITSLPTGVYILNSTSRTFKFHKK